MKLTLTKAWWFFTDLFYPMLQPLSKEETKRQQVLVDGEKALLKERIAALPNDETILTLYLDECVRLLNEEEDVRRGVEGRLTSIVGLSSIAGSIVFGGILAQATGSLHPQPTPIRIVLALGTLYLTLQVCCAILASVKGLERQGYPTQMASDILPSPAEEQRGYLRRQIATCAERLDDSRQHRGRKVQQMAVAHRAMKNFVWALILMAILGTIFTIQSKHQVW